MRASATAVVRHAPPPAPLSRFIGRTRELAVVEELLPTTRLISLTGSGGSGKTRLAAEVVRRVADRWPTIAWIDLASLNEPAGLANHVAAGFGLTERSDDTAADALRLSVGDSPTLLVLDNCEHVIDAVAHLAESLLRRVPTLTVLTTSREPLGVQGETAWLVPPLVDDECVDLFVERARTVQPAFPLTPDTRSTVGEICRRVDGIPLAIELAASRVKVLSVDQIEERLADSLHLLSGGSRTALPRHRTLRATIEWSYALLSSVERTLLARLSVFPASFSLEAAESITPDGRLERDDILDLLASLVDKSLVVLDASESDVRYRLLEIVRQFAAELVSPAERELLRRKHADFFLSLAEFVAPRIFGKPLQFELAPETANLRAAVEWAGNAPERAEHALRFVWALQWYWWGKGPFQEARRLADALTQPTSPLIRARALIAFCQMGCWQGRFDEALRYGEGAMAMLDEVVDNELRAILLTLTGAARTLVGDFDRALIDLAEAVPLGRTYSKTIIGGIALHFRGLCLTVMGDLEGAWKAYDEQLSMLNTHGSGACHALAGQGAILHLRGDVDAAEERFRSGLIDAAHDNDRWGIVKNTEGIALCRSVTAPRSAARLLGAAEAHRERIAHPMWIDELQRYEPVVARLREQLGASFATHWAAGRALSDDDSRREALGDASSATTATTIAHTGNRSEAAESVVIERAGTATAPSASGAATAEFVLNTLGRFEAVRRGVPIDASAWGSSRPRELLVYLACHPAGVTKEQAGLALWPDASPPQVRNNFHVTVHRLRKALGDSEWIVVADDRYALARQLDVQFDVTLFENGIRSGIAALKRGDVSGAAVLAAALDRYRGPFLDGDTVGDWAHELSDQLVRRYVDGGTVYARWLLDEGRNAEAASVLRAVIACDPLVEEVWAMLMLACARAGDSVQALRVYQQVEAILLADLEVLPSPDTRALRTRIQRGEPV